MTRTFHYRIGIRNGRLTRSVYSAKYTNEMNILSGNYYHITDASLARLIFVANGGNGDEPAEILPTKTGWMAVWDA